MNAAQSHLKATVVSSVVLLVGAATACGGKDRPAQDASGTVTTTTTDAPTADARDRQTTVQVSKPLRDRCNMPATVQEAPAFEYDQATLRARGQNVLDDVATCLTDGPLKGEVITIVGRSDPRGSASYNESLAQSRAAAAQNYLVQKGVPKERIKLVARGEAGARGTDEETWALDRRVDLEFGDLTSSPILQGSMLQAEAAKQPDNSPEAKKASSYADVAEGNPATSTAKGGTTASPAK